MLRAYSSLGLAYAQLGRLPEALEAFQKAAAIRPRGSRNPVLLGNGPSHAGKQGGGAEGAPDFDTPGRTPEGQGMLKDQLDRQSPGDQPRD